MASMCCRAVFSGVGHRERPPAPHPQSQHFLPFLLPKMGSLAVGPAIRLGTVDRDTGTRP